MYYNHYKIEYAKELLISSKESRLCKNPLRAFFKNSINSALSEFTFIYMELKCINILKSDKQTCIDCSCCDMLLFLFSIE